MVRSLSFPLKPFKIMGIVNLTPDSFSDGGLVDSPLKAFDRVLKLHADGADFVDLGAESTRPGARAISIDEEWSRLEPVLKLIFSRPRPGLKISVDTRNPANMLRSIELGAHMINDVTSSADLETLSALASDKSIAYLGNHSYGPPSSMQDQPLRSEQVTGLVWKFFQDQMEKLVSAGFSLSQIWLDPGLGFGKTDQANLALWSSSCEFSKTYQIAMGVSRKSMLGRLFDIENPRDRDPVSKVAELSFALGGVQMIRTHDVGGLERVREVLTRAD